MRVFVIVGLLLITLPAIAGPREKSVEQTQNDDARAMLVLTFYHHAMDRVCAEVKTADDKDACYRAHWALWREVYSIQKRTGAFNLPFYRFCKRFMAQVRDHMLNFAPPEK